jgi:uncharacterized protein YjbI with pentapeptide repeats
MNPHAKLITTLAMGLLVGFLTGQLASRHFQAHGQPDDDDLTERMQSYHESGESLAKFEVRCASLENLSLPSANLSMARLVGCVLYDSDFSGANLTYAHLSGSSLIGANLEGATLSNARIPNCSFSLANLAGADLMGADAQFTYLLRADLSGANLERADFRGAYLGRTDLSGARVHKANFAGASLMWADLANLEGWETITDVTGLNVFDVHNPPPGFVDWAMENGAVNIPHKEWLASLEDEAAMEGEASP